MAENLPCEIVKNITIHLPRNDPCTCLRVCRSWNTALTPTLYRAVEIHSERHFDRFHKALCDTKACNQLGHHVRKIDITDFVNYTKLTLLPKLCPFVTEFYYEDIRYPELATILQRWKYLARMPMVYISEKPLGFQLELFQKQITRIHISVDQYPEWIDLVSTLPYIRDLEVDFGSIEPSGSTKYMALSDLEMLLNSLPRLHSLTMNRFSTYGDLPEDIAPCDTLNSLVLLPFAGGLWGSYFARKYTTLKKLELRTREYDSADLLMEIMTLVKSCRHLNRFTCSQEDIFSGIHKNVLRILFENGEPLTYLDVSHYDACSYEMLVYDSHQTLSNATNSEIFINSTEELVKPLKACLLLVDLRLQFFLQLFGSRSRVGLLQKPRSSPVHGTVIENIMFPYLSYRCPRLSYLNCGYNVPHNNSDLVIHFPSPSLKHLKVKTGGKPIFKLTQMGKTERILERSVRYHGSIDGHKTKSWTRWYFAYIGRHDWLLRRLRLMEKNDFSCRLWNNDKGYNLKALQDITAYQILEDDYSNATIVSIQCHSVDKICLQHVSLN
ncbi:hypothetical protein DFQ29_004621 [Apophysomyces sp. BC1021]|nr:hypothetical protein DFQ29_004621 [Apophysomyces sp. BC1021]